MQLAISSSSSLKSATHQLLIWTIEHVNALKIVH